MVTIMTWQLHPTNHSYFPYRPNFERSHELSRSILTGNPSPLWIASDGGCENLVRVLLEMVSKCSSSVRPESSSVGTSAFEIATAHKHHGIMKMLLDSRIFSADEVTEVCHRFGEIKFMEAHFGLLAIENPLLRLTRNFPLYNEGAVEVSDIRIPSRYVLSLCRLHGPYCQPLLDFQNASGTVLNRNNCIYCLERYR